MDLRDLGYHYFGLTLKKQYEMDDYDLRDWCHNCISLSEYYTENGYYAQAEYLLLVGMNLVPEDDTEKLVATFQMTLGKVHL
jgi:hypothetical protein